MKDTELFFQFQLFVFICWKSNKKYESYRELLLEFSFLPSLWPKVSSYVSFSGTSFFFFLTVQYRKVVHQEGGNVLPSQDIPYGYPFIAQRLFWDVLVASAALKLGKDMNLGLMRFTVHVQSISIAQSVGATMQMDCTKCKAGPMCPRYIEPTACLLYTVTVAICLGILSGALWQLLLLHWGWDCLEVIGKHTTLCNVVCGKKLRSIGNLENLDPRIFF